VGGAQPGAAPVPHPVMAEFAEIWRPLEKIVFSTTSTSVEGSNRLATGMLVVGGGTPYFPPDVDIDLELVETRTFDATVYLHYRRRG
jgi:hypothetical protein